MYRLSKMMAVLGACVVALGGFAAKAGAVPIVMDNFTGAQGPVSSSGAFASNTAVVAGIAPVFGTVRSIDILSTGSDADIRVGGGRVVISNNETIGSVSHVTYNFGAQGFALDYSGVNTITIDNAIQDGAAGGNPTISLLFNGSIATAAQAVTVGGGDLVFNLAGLGIGAVSQFQIVINTPSGGAVPGRAGTDMSFGPLELDNSPPRLLLEPEPATLATFGLVTLLGGFAARRRMKGAAVAQA
jgi:hypothetical protein